MMLKFLALAVIAVAVTASTDSEWAVYKARHAKKYLRHEDKLRRLIYEENLQYIQNHNQLFLKGVKSFFLAENEYSDMTNYEFVKTMNGYKGSILKGERSTQQQYSFDNVNIPSEVNWVKKGYVTAVKNQGQCGSCWSFSTTGSLEGAHFKKTGTLVSLSEQNLMDCSRSYGNNGCDGGLMDNAFKYIIANKGLDTEASYPYEAKDDRCRFNRTNVGATEISYRDVTSGSEEALQLAVASVGPVSVAIDAGHRSFQLYSGGVYNEPECSSERLDHGVLAVGYGTESGKDYWLVKNSWGPSWGENGYIKMSRNHRNQCGIATQASYPLV